MDDRIGLRLRAARASRFLAHALSIHGCASNHRHSTEMVRNLPPLLVNPHARALLEALNQQPATVADLAAAVPQLSDTALRDWLDLLWAGGKIAPFLPVDQVARIDRERLRRINRERIGWPLRELSTSSRVPLLAAEVGNCLVAGWFECLVLANLERRHQPALHRQILARLQKAGMAFGDGHGKAAPNQLTALLAALEQLEAHCLCKMAYWGIDV